LTKIKLTDAERLILSNQYQILALLQPDQAKEHARANEIVTSGYEFYYSDLNPSLSDPVPAEVSEEIIDILDMFRAIEFSTRELGKKPSDYRIAFEGLDGNNDHPQYWFTKFVRRDLGRWEELKAYPDNSHTQTSLPTYRRMLSKWKANGKKFEMSHDDLTALAK
jgi:uncharacterized protein YfbU (UPF0304 family)